jgi:VanZ family protein
MTPLRLRRLWLFLGCCFLALVVYFSLAPSLPSAAQKIWDKASHLLSYAWLMLWFAQLPRKFTNKAIGALALIGLGIALEFLQGLGSVRHADALDGLANTLGVGGGLLLSLTPLGAVLRKLEAATIERH